MLVGELELLWNLDIEVVDFDIGLYMQHLVFPVTHYVLVHGLFLVLKRLHGLKP